MSVQSLTGFNTGDCAVNGFGQKVKIYDISKGEIAFMWIDENYAEVMHEDKFDKLFEKVDKNGKEKKR